MPEQHSHEMQGQVSAAPGHIEQALAEIQEERVCSSRHACSHLSFMSSSGSPKRLSGARWICVCVMSCTPMRLVSLMRPASSPEPPTCIIHMVPAVLKLVISKAFCPSACSLIPSVGPSVSCYSPPTSTFLFCNQAWAEPRGMKVVVFTAPSRAAEMQ